MSFQQQAKKRADSLAQDALLEEAVRRRRENEQAVVQRLDGLHNVLERHMAAVEELDRVEASLEPIHMATVYNAGISVETTLRDRKCQERELMEWTQNVVARHLDEEAELQQIADAVSETDHAVVNALEPSSIGTSIRNAVHLLQQYGAKQMRLARAIESSELNATDAGRRLVDDTEKLVAAVARELDRSKRSTPAEVAAMKEMTTRRIKQRHPAAASLQQPRNAVRGNNSRGGAAATSQQLLHDFELDEGKDEVTEVSVTLLKEELTAAKAARASFEALCKDLQSQADRHTTIISALEAALESRSAKMEALQRQLQDMQVKKLQHLATISTQCTAINYDIKGERSSQTDSLRGLPGLQLLKRTASHASAALTARGVFGAAGLAAKAMLARQNQQVTGVGDGSSSPTAQSLDGGDSFASSPRHTGSRRAFPFSGGGSGGPNDTIGDDEIGAGWQRTLVHGGRRPVWSTDAVARLFQCFSVYSRRDRVKTIVARFCAKSLLLVCKRRAGLATIGSSKSPIPGAAAHMTSEATASVVSQIRKAKEAQQQMELKLRYRERELAKSIEQNYALSSELAHLKKQASASAFNVESKSAASSPHITQQQQAATTAHQGEVLQIPTKSLDIVALCIAAWRGVRVDIGKRITELPSLSFADELAARCAMLDRDVTLLNDMDSYFMGTGPRLEAIAHPQATTLASLVGQIADQRDQDAATFAMISHRLQTAISKGDGGDGPTALKVPGATRKSRSGNKLSSSIGFRPPGAQLNSPKNRTTETNDSTKSPDEMEQSQLRSATAPATSSSGFKLPFAASAPVPSNESVPHFGGEVVAVSCSSPRSLNTNRRRDDGPSKAVAGPSTRRGTNQRTAALQQQDNAKRAARSSDSPAAMIESEEDHSDDDSDGMSLHQGLLASLRGPLARPSSIHDHSTVTVEYRRQTSSSSLSGGVVQQVASRGVQCTPQQFGAVEIASALLKRLQKRAARRTGGGGSDLKAWTPENDSLPMRRIAAANARTKAAQQLRHQPRDSEMLRGQVHCVYRTIVAKAKSRVLIRAAARPHSGRREWTRLLAMIARHEADAKRHEADRVRILLERAARYEQFFVLADDWQHEGEVPPIVVTALRPAELSRPSPSESASKSRPQWTPVAPPPPPGTTIHHGGLHSQTARLRFQSRALSTPTFQSARSITAPGLCVGHRNELPTTNEGLQRPPMVAAGDAVSTTRRPPSARRPTSSALEEDNCVLTPRGVGGSTGGAPRMQSPDRVAPPRLNRREPFFVVPKHRFELGA